MLPRCVLWERGVSRCFIAFQLDEYKEINSDLERDEQRLRNQLIALEEQASAAKERVLMLEESLHDLKEKRVQELSAKDRDMKKLEYKLEQLALQSKAVAERYESQVEELLAEKSALMNEVLLL